MEAGEVNLSKETKEWIEKGWDRFNITQFEALGPKIFKIGVVWNAKDGKCWTTINVRDHSGNLVHRFERDKGTATA